MLADLREIGVTCILPLACVTPSLESPTSRNPVLHITQHLHVYSTPVLLTVLSSISGTTLPANPPKGDLCVTIVKKCTFMFPHWFDLAASIRNGMGGDAFGFFLVAPSSSDYSGRSPRKLLTQGPLRPTNRRRPSSSLLPSRRQGVAAYGLAA